MVVSAFPPLKKRMPHPALRRGRDAARNRIHEFNPILKPVLF